MDRTWKDMNTDIDHKPSHKPLKNWAVTGTQEHIHAAQAKFSAVPACMSQCLVVRMTPVLADAVDGWMEVPECQSVVQDQSRPGD